MPMGPLRQRWGENGAIGSWESRSDGSERVAKSSERVLSGGCCYVSSDDGIQTKGLVAIALIGSNDACENGNCVECISCSPRFKKAKAWRVKLVPVRGSEYNLITDKERKVIRVEDERRTGRYGIKTLLLNDVVLALYSFYYPTFTEAMEYLP